MDENFNLNNWDVGGEPIKDLSKDEQSRLIEILKNEKLALQFMFAFYLETGARISEGLECTVGDLRQAMIRPQPAIYLRTLKARAKKVLDPKKKKTIKIPPQKKYRIIPIRKNPLHPDHPDFIFFDLCERWLYFRRRDRDEYPLIIAPRYNREKRAFKISRPGRMTIHDQVKRFMIMVGCPDLSTHSLRHTFAMNRLREGCPLPVLQKLMGHVTISSLTPYVSPRQDALFAAMGFNSNSTPTETYFIKDGVLCKKSADSPSSSLLSSPSQAAEMIQTQPQEIQTERISTPEQSKEPIDSNE